jgi:hypothetical protein
MALLCTHEHYLVHHDGWEVRMAADGHPEMIPPPWVDPNAADLPYALTERQAT